MKKRIKGLIAIVCSIALVIGSFATYTATISADGDDNDYSTLEYRYGGTVVTRNKTGDPSVTQDFYYAVYPDETSTDMINEYDGWATPVHTYGGEGEYLEFTWHAASALYNGGDGPEKVVFNGQEYTSSTPPIHNLANTLLQIHAIDENGIVKNSYNTIKVVAGSHYITIVVRVGGPVAPTNVEATPVSSVPGCATVSWTASNPPAGQTYRVYVDGDLKKSNITGTSTTVNNIPAGTHTLEVKGYAFDMESDPAEGSVTIATGVDYTNSI